MSVYLPGKLGLLHRQAFPPSCKAHNVLQMSFVGFGVVVVGLVVVTIVEVVVVVVGTRWLA